ncbi:ribonuclease E inhibitor RraB [Nocardioides sp.]|uniref:ribonuclease E inhibitor RraB n=1 Tax=Nocardioides sp. TaxID=35761 RepID=UPI002ED62CE9
MGIFRRRTGHQSHLTLPSTGHAGDDALLAQIAAHTDLEAPRHWVHYLYFEDELQARGAAEVIGSAGWQIQRVDVSASGGPDWVVIIETHAATTPNAVREARLFFEGVAATHAGGDYDGWEASL